jgi:hypothetical protein
MGWAHVSTFSVSKRGSTRSECEDAAWVSPTGDRTGEVDEPSLRIIVADGASESLLAAKWARRLTDSFGAATTPTTSLKGFLKAYRSATEGWVGDVQRYVQEREQRGFPIQWYEEPGLAKGAFSTVIAVEVTWTSESHGSWRAAALGDSCAFHVRDECLRRSFPLDDPEAFSNQPPLLASRPVEDEIIRRNVCLYRAGCETGDSFYVMTDALAAWFLRTSSAGGRPWGRLRDMGEPDLELDFSAWVERKRDEGGLRNDDTTLVRLDIY